MYLETIYLIEEEHGHAHGVDIANRLGISKAGVTKAVNKLKDKGLVLKENYGTITLTESGKKSAMSIYENHKLITEFLVKSLGLNCGEAADNACRIEHVISDEMKDAIVKYLDSIDEK